MLGVRTTVKIDEPGASAICAYDSCCRELAADSAKRNKPPLISFVIALGPFGTVVKRLFCVTLAKCETPELEKIFPEYSNISLRGLMAR